jgi:hypothetical protein
MIAERLMIRMTYSMVDAFLGIGYPFMRHPPGMSVNRLWPANSLSIQEAEVWNRAGLSVYSGARKWPHGHFAQERQF